MGKFRDESNSDWVTASDLAEYAYCPRALWFRWHPPPEGPAPASRSDRTRGDRFHDSELGRRARRERWSGVGWVLVGGGFLLFLFAFLIVVHP